MFHSGNGVFCVTVCMLQKISYYIYAMDSARLRGKVRDHLKPFSTAQDQNPNAPHAKTVKKAATSFLYVCFFPHFHNTTLVVIAFWVKHECASIARACTSRKKLIVGAALEWNWIAQLQQCTFVYMLPPAFQGKVKKNYIFRHYFITSNGVDDRESR